MLFLDVRLSGCPPDCDCGRRTISSSDISAFGANAKVSVLIFSFRAALGGKKERFCLFWKDWQTCLAMIKTDSDCDKSLTIIIGAVSLFGFKL